MRNLNEALLNPTGESLPSVLVSPAASPAPSGSWPHFTTDTNDDQLSRNAKVVANYSMPELHLLMMNLSGVTSPPATNAGTLTDRDAIEWLVIMRYLCTLNDPSRAKGHDLFVAISTILSGGYSDRVKMMALLFSRDFSQNIHQLPPSQQAMYRAMLLQLWSLLIRLEAVCQTDSPLTARPSDTLNSHSLDCDYTIGCDTDGGSEPMIKPALNLCRTYRDDIVLMKNLIASAFVQLSSAIPDQATNDIATSISMYTASSTGSRLHKASKFSYAVTYFIAVLKLIQSRANNFRLWGFRGYDVGLNAALVAGVAYSNPVVSLIQRILAVLVYIPLLALRLFNACEVDNGGEYLKIRRGQMANDAMWGAVALLSITVFVWLIIVSGGLAGMLAVGALPLELKIMTLVVSIANIGLYFYDLFFLIIKLKRTEVKHMESIITELHMEQDVNNDDNSLLLLCDDLSKSAQKTYNISWKKALALLIGKLCFIALIVIAEATLATSVITLLVWLAVAGAVIMFAANCWFWWYYERKQTRIAGCAAWQPSHIWCDITGLYYQRYLTLARQWIEEKQRRQVVADQLTQQAKGAQVLENIEQQQQRIDSETILDKRQLKAMII